MAEHLKTDEEKAEELRAWWRENGISVVAGVGLAIAGLFGWQYWQEHQIKSAESASLLYSKSKQTTSHDEAVQYMTELQEDYPSTPYAAMAMLESAKNYAAEGDYANAAGSLHWVAENTKEAEYRDVARLRLARVLLADNKADEALALVDQGDYPAAYESLREELRGDIYAAKNENDKARAAYQRAIVTNSDSASDLIQLKLDNLPEDRKA
ncbi:MAG: tetratricopeptide repeat protein [Thiothrix sp.]|nr:tetratricopeptide repeat protein [Thiothrix sp.]HPE61840.1 tetratricopeptide repeat protein [Thiolinea sp.]